MSESIISHLLLCESLSFSRGKTPPTDLTDKSKFLSSLALVLNGDETSTAVYINQADKIVFIARNERITPIDQRYFDRLFRLIRIYDNLCFDKDKETVTEEVKQLLYSHVFEYNSKKIIKRFVGKDDKMIGELGKMIQWDKDQRSHFIQELLSNQEKYRKKPFMTEKLYLLGRNKSEEQYVEFLFEKVDAFLVALDQLIQNKVNPTDQQLELATWLASILYQSRLFEHILTCPVGTGDKGVYYFEKTSGHKRSINLLLKCLVNWKDNYGETYKNVSWKLVPSITTTRPLTVTPKQAFEKIFTNLSLSSDQNVCSGFQRITSEAFYGNHLQKMKKFDETGIHVGHVHAEILLIDHLLQNNTNKEKKSIGVEIGISKMPCLLCAYYIDALNKHHGRYFCQFNSTHGKIYPNWTYRNNEDPSI